MNYLDHARLSAHKFGGTVQDYIEIHKFMDSSKLFYHHAKHRLLLHNLYGVELCTDLFGNLITLANGREIITRDIAIEHCKEDLNGKVPTIGDWISHYHSNSKESEILLNCLQKIENKSIKEFLYRPYLRSGIAASLNITNSNFGLYLASNFFCINDIIQLKNIGIFDLNVDSWLKEFSFTSNWQFTPKKEDLNLLNQLSCIEEK